MSIGGLLAGAGNVNTGMRRAEQEAQIARMRQLAIQQGNRQQEADRLKTQGGTAGYEGMPEIPNYMLDGANAPTPEVLPGRPRAQVLAEARATMEPDDYAVAFVQGQGAPAPTPEQPAAWQPPARGPDGMVVMPEQTAGVQLPPQPPTQPQPAAEPLPGAAGVFRRGADEFAASQTTTRSTRRGSRPARSGAPAGVTAPPPVAATQTTAAPPRGPVPSQPTETQPEGKLPPAGPMAAALEPPAGVSTPKTKGAATDDTESPSAFYAGNPAALTGDRVRLDKSYERMRGRLLKQAQAYERVGSGTQMNQILDQLDVLDQQYEQASMLLEGNAALMMFEFANDPRAMDAVLTDYLGGTPVQTQLREDGTNDLYIGGQLQGTYHKAEYTDMVRQLFDVNYREATAASKSAVSMEMLKNQLAKDLKVTEIQAKALADIALEMTKGTIRFREMEIEGRKFKIAMEPNTNTAVFYSDDGGYLGRLDLNSGITTESPAGPLNVPPQLQRATTIGR